MLVILALLLVLEGLSTGARILGRLPTLVVYSWPTLVLMAVRGGVGVLQFASGWMLLERRPFGAVLGRWCYLVSAALVTFEIGMRLVPTNLFPSYRWPVVCAYWVYAMAAAWYLTRRRPR